jgi:hypothetical protein
VRRRRLAITLVMLSLPIGLNAGCLSLSAFNREVPETKARLDALEKRVSALEVGNAVRSGQPVMVPGPQP